MNKTHHTLLMDNFSEMLMSIYFMSEEITAESLYSKNTWIPWISAILGTFIVGLSGLVPLLIIPDSTPSNASQSSRRDVNRVITRSHKVDDQAVLIRRHSRQQLQADVIKKEQTLKRYLSFAVGSLLGDICLHLLPEIYRLKIDSRIDYSNGHQMRLGISILVGILSFLAIEKIFEFTQQQETPKEANNNNLSDRGKVSKPIIGYLNLFANCIDNFVHGLAVAASFLTGLKLGIITTIAVLVHEIPHEIADFAILLKSGFSRWEAAKAQFWTASVGMMGAVAALWLDSDSANNSSNDVTNTLDTNLILAFSAGGFLHIAMVSILPDLLCEKDPKEAFIHLILIFLGISVMGLMSVI